MDGLRVVRMDEHGEEKVRKGDGWTQSRVVRRLLTGTWYTTPNTVL